MTPDEFAADALARVYAHDAQRDRSQQSQTGQIGVSDIGTCRERARLTLLNTPHEPSASFSAIVGTAWHTHMEAVYATHPSGVVEQEVVVTLPSGQQLLGHIDFIDVLENSVTDWKTIDGRTPNKGSADQQRYQRHLYALGAIQAGLVVEENLLVRNVFWDRSARNDMPVVVQEPYDPDVATHADYWFDDVRYALQHGEEASKDKWPDWCADFCPFFTACRGEDTRTGEVLDPALAEVALDYDAIREQHKTLTGTKEDLARQLRGRNGVGIVGDRKVILGTTAQNRDEGASERLSVKVVAA